MIFRGDDIKRLIPQREPFIMVDEFESSDDTSAVTRLIVTPGNYFITYDGTMAETGYIEHIAQSCSALAGFKAAADKAPVGIIAEVKHFTCQRRASVNETIVTQVSFGMSFGQMTIAHGTSRINGDVVAETDLKIFIQG